MAPVTWSTVLQSPLAKPSISSTSVHIERLNEWKKQWLVMQRGSRMACDSKRNDRFCPLGPLPDYDPDTVEEGSEHLWRCCHGWRPAAKDRRLFRCQGFGRLSGKILHGCRKFRGPNPNAKVVCGVGHRCFGTSGLKLHVHY
jgi:hypothetical protein